MKIKTDDSIWCIFSTKEGLDHYLKSWSTFRRGWKWGSRPEARDFDQRYIKTIALESTILRVLYEN